MLPDFHVPLDQDGKIIDFLSGQPLEPKPEEFVRQQFLRVLHFEYRYPKNVMRREVSIVSGSKVLSDASGNPVRADIVIYNSPTALSKNDQGNFFLVVECKAPTENAGYNQLVSYIFNTSASGGVWYNGSGQDAEIRYFRRIAKPTDRLEPWIGFPKFQETWDSIGRRNKSQLERPANIHGLLRRCHNKLHARGSESEEEDLTMDMVRMILAKARDEEREGDDTLFYCTPDQYSNEAGRQNVADRIASLFEEVKSSNPGVFTEHERITVGNRAVCDVVVELQRYQLLADYEADDFWDLMGHAYEEYTDVYLKRRRGQFFTNRLIVNFLVDAVSPKEDDIILDPAGGSGGFLTASLRFIRRKILESKRPQAAKQTLLAHVKERLHMVEISRRLVKVAKTAMILNGDGHGKMVQGDSLQPISQLPPEITTSCGQGKPDVILTNPPFAGVGEGRITQIEILKDFQVAKRMLREPKEYMIATSDIATDGVPPEMLFFERCIQWLRPGGRLGIVMPKSFLDTDTYFSTRRLLFSTCQLLAVVNCHKNTFQPHTGVRTCLIVARKLEPKEVWEEQSRIFMAVSRKVGQDSEGVPIFKRDEQNKELDDLDEDMIEIGSKLADFRAGTLTQSEYIFTVPRSAIGQNLNINPQQYLPSFNETLRLVSSIDGVAGWSVSSLSQVCQGIQVFKGPRLKSENLIVDEQTEDSEPYYTPTAVLQEKSDSVKNLRVSRASTAQLAVIKAIRVQRGDIVVTRSGSIGRVAIITARLNEAIVSDDLIRVRIPDQLWRNYITFLVPRCLKCAVTSLKRAVSGRACPRAGRRWP